MASSRAGIVFSVPARPCAADRARASRTPCSACGERDRSWRAAAPRHSRQSAGSARPIAPDANSLTPTMTWRPRFDVLLKTICAFGNFALRISALDRGNHAAHAVNGAEVMLGILFQTAGQMLDEVRAAERIDRPGHAGLVREDLLCAQRQRRGRRRWQRERLVERARVERVGPAKDGGQRL